MLPVKGLLFEKADPSLVSIKIELIGHLGVIIDSAEYTFSFFSRSQILASRKYIFNYKSTAA